MDIKESFMKKTLKLLGIIALIAVIGFSAVSCGDLSEATNSLSGVTASSTTTARLTITKLPDGCNGYYVDARDAVVKGQDNYQLSATGAAFLKGVKVENGSVTLYVWKTTEISWGDYNGSDKDVIFSLRFASDESMTKINFNILEDNEVKADFTNGVGTAEYKTGKESN